MTNDYKWLNLQLFAGEGAGGDGGGEGASTGDNPAAAGQQRLMELGVPERLAKKHSERAAKRNAATAVRSNPAKEQVATAAEAPEANPTEGNNAEATTETTKQRMTWDEIKADPEYNSEIQKIVQQRLKASKSSEEAMDKLTPALELLARQYGLDHTKIDHDALAKAICEDNSFFEKRAMELGITAETARKLEQQEQERTRQQQVEQQTLEQQRFQAHIQKLEQQGEAMKAKFPNFDLRVELQNPAFARMTGPNVGISVEDAYYAIHRNEIQTAAMQATAQKTAEKLSNSIQAGQRRPIENGTSAQAPSVTTFDYRAASKDQRQALKRQIMEAAARGEKVYPGR